MRTVTAILSLSAALLSLAFPYPSGAQEIPQPLFGNCCSCKAQIKALPALDLLKVGARIVPTPLAIIDPVTTGMHFELSNANGIVFSETIPPGAFEEKGGGRKYVYKNGAARTSGGIFTASLQSRNDAVGGWVVSIKAYGDLSGATLPEMSTVIAIGTSSFFDVSDWEPRGSGWRKEFPEL